MKKFIIHWILLGLVVYFALPHFIDGIVVDQSRAGIIAAILFAFINITAKPIIRIVTLPLNIFSLGIFGLIVNILLFWFVAEVVDGIMVADLMVAAWGSVAMILANWIIDKILD